LSKRIHITSGAPWEETVGYSRAIRVGNFVEVSGTTAVDGDDVLFPGDPYNQAQFIFLKIKQALEDAGSGLKDVVRTRMYVTDIDHWSEIGKAHAECFKDVKPAATMVEVYSLIREGLVVEIEVSAIISDS